MQVAEASRSPQELLLQVDQVYTGDCRQLLPCIEPASIALSVWSPPYFVGKSYEKDLTFEEWRSLLGDVICKHVPLLKPGGFLAINIADILCFQDETMPRIQAVNPSRRRHPITKEDIMKVLEEHPGFNRYQTAKVLGCSEQTVDRRLKNNNIRGGKHCPQPRVMLVGGMIEEYACKAGLYLYDRRVWVKDPAWENGRWHSLSYRSVDEFEHIYIFWKPGITKVDRCRLRKEEWAEWGSRAVWYIPSVRANDDHEAKFPLELPRRLVRLLSDPGEVVLDCFLGSGTTALAAIREGRHFIGIDIDPRYAELARESILRERCTSRRRAEQCVLL